MADGPTSSASQIGELSVVGPELPDALLSKLRLEIRGYQLLNKIETGGQATVYRARELTSGLTVAIKILNGGPNADPAARERFKRETATLKALNHPNIVCVIEASQTPTGLDYLVMNYVDGRPLDALWKSPEFGASVAPEPIDRLRLFKRICEIVQVAHLKGITHRDLSPSNLLITENGEPHVLDFGLATTAFNQVLSPDGKNVSVTGQFLGKVQYAAPEQARGAPDQIDIRTDVYALGVILYQILTNGVFPYEVGGNLIDVLNNIVSAPPRPPSAVLAAREKKKVKQLSQRRSGPLLLNESIEAIVLKALEKDPARRYQSAGELASDLDLYLAGKPTTAILQRKSTIAARPWNYKSYRNAGAAAVTAILIIGVLMNLRSILTWLGVAVVGASLAAGPAVKQHDEEGARLRQRARLGSAPKTEFRVGNHTIQIGKEDPGIKAVRSLPPKSFEPDARRKSVEGFYKEKLGPAAADKSELAKLNVGRFRPEFLWWVRYRWALRDWAWWAWNNYAYVDGVLWDSWMENAEFKAQIAQYQSQNLPRQPGFIPVQYASTPAEAIYGDEYIEAVYNPVLAPPSIVVDATTGPQVENLIEGVSRTSGADTAPINSVADGGIVRQFLSVSANSNPDYVITVQRDGVLYLFGPRRTPLLDGVDDASHWEGMTRWVQGPGIDMMYKRNVTAGDKIHLHGYEWSIVSDQIDLLDTATPEARTAVRMADADLIDLIQSDQLIYQSRPELKDYLRRAQDAEQSIVTQLGNINDENLGVYYGELDKVHRMSLDAAAAQSSDSQLVASAQEVARRASSLENDLNDVDQLRNPNAANAQDNGAAGGIAAAANDDARTSVLGLWHVRDSIGWEGTFTFNQDGTCIAKDEQGAANGKWSIEGENLKVQWPRRENTWHLPVQNGEMKADGVIVGNGRAYTLWATKIEGDNQADNAAKLTTDRQIAEQVLQVGGSLSYSTVANPNNRVNNIKGVDELPQGDFAVVAIDLDGKQDVGDEQLSFLASATSVDWLRLRGTQVTDQTLQNVISKLSNLNFLQLAKTKISSRGLEALPNLKHLEILNLNLTQVSDLSALSGMQQLKNLQVWNCPAVTDQSIKAIAGLSNLNVLNLGGTQITDDGLRSVSGLSKLTSLGLGGTQITDNGLAHLRNLTNLEELGIANTQVTDDGVKALSGLPNLKKIWITGTAINEAVIKQIWPDCQINPR